MKLLALLTYKHISAPINEKTKIKELYEMIREEAEKEGRTKSTMDVLSASYKAIETLKNEPLFELTSMDFQFIIDELIDDENTKSSFSKLNKIKSLISKMYDILIKYKIMNINHAKIY